MHLGDIVSLEVMEHLQGLCRLEAVRGNCDMPDVRRGLAIKRTLEIEGLKIGLIHGRGGADETFRLVKEEFQGKVDVALFGHTHAPFHAREGGTLYFNPGSLHDGRNGARSFGILHPGIDDDQPWGEIIEI